MHKQAVHIQSLIQENSRLNIKMLLENAEKMNLGSDFGKLDYNYTNGSNFATICFLSISASLTVISTFSFLFSEITFVYLYICLPNSSGNLRSKIHRHIRMSPASAAS